MFIINNYGEFRIVCNDIAYISKETIVSEDQIRSFVEDLIRACDKVLRALQGLASRVDPLFTVDQISDGLRDGDPVFTNDVTADPLGVSSSLSRALDRSIPLTVTEGDTKYCHGAEALQKGVSRSVEDIAVDGKPRMQYTYVCKFCFLQISSYQQLVRKWGPYEWVTLAKSHVVACTSWLDSRALFKCRDCDKLGREHVTIDANEFVIHTQEHLQNASTQKVPRESAYSYEKVQSGPAPPRKSYKETMAELEKEIAAYEKLVEMELAGDAEVQHAKEAAVPLVEGDEEGNGIDEWYHTTHKTEANKETPRHPKTTAKPQKASIPAAKLSSSYEEHGISPPGPSISELAIRPPPYQPTQHSASTEAVITQTLGEKSPLTAVPSSSSDPSKDSQMSDTSFREKEVPNYGRRSSRGVPATEKAIPEKDAPSSSPVQHRQVGIKILPTPAAIPELDDGLAACPGCGRRMKTEAVFEHLDTCPSNINSRIAPPQPDARSRTQATKREAVTRSSSDCVLSNMPTQRISEADVARSTQAGELTRPAFSDDNAYQAGNRAPSTLSPQPHQSAPTRPPPVPPQQQVLRPNAVRKATPAEAVENYEAQRYFAQGAVHPQTPSSQRTSRDLHVRQGGTPTASGQRTPHPPGGHPDWQTSPMFEGWQPRE